MASFAQKSTRKSFNTRKKGIGLAFPVEPTTGYGRPASVDEEDVLPECTAKAVTNVTRDGVSSGSAINNQRLPGKVEHE